MKLFDPACYDLAAHFLRDDNVSPALNELRIQSLAGAIQQAVEDWCSDEEADGVIGTSSTVDTD